MEPPSLERYDQFIANTKTSPTMTEAQVWATLALAEATALGAMYTPKLYWPLYPADPGKP